MPSFFKFHYNIHPSIHSHSNSLFPSAATTKLFMHFTTILYLPHVLPSSSSLIWRSLQIMNLLIMQFSADPSYLLSLSPLGPHILLSNLFSKIFDLGCFFQDERSSFKPTKTAVILKFCISEILKFVIMLLSVNGLKQEKLRVGYLKW